MGQTGTRRRVIIRRSVAALIAVLLVVGAAYRFRDQLLVEAVKHGLTGLGAVALSLGASANAEDAKHLTALSWAASRGHVEVLELLLRHGANPNANDNACRGTALHCAASHGQMRAVEILLAYGTNPNAQGAFGITPVYVSALRRHFDVTRMLLQHGGRSSLFVATALGDAHEVGQMLRQGANPNEQDAYEMTPLHWAASLGEPQIATLLVSHGAQVDARDRNGAQPLRYAAELGEVKMVKSLISYGSSVNDMDKVKGATPLHWSALNGHLETAAILVKAGANINARDRWGYTPLQWAESRHMTAMCDQLRAWGAK